MPKYTSTNKQKTNYSDIVHLSRYPHSHLVLLLHRCSPVVQLYLQLVEFCILLQPFYYFALISQALALSTCSLSHQKRPSLSHYEVHILNVASSQCHLTKCMLSAFYGWSWLIFIYHLSIVYVYCIINSTQNCLQPLINKY